MIFQIHILPQSEKKGIAPDLPLFCSIWQLNGGNKHYWSVSAEAQFPQGRMRVRDVHGGLGSHVAPLWPVTTVEQPEVCGTSATFVNYSLLQCTFTSL